MTKLQNTIFIILAIIALAIAGLTDGWVEWVAIGAGFVLAIVGIVIIHSNKKKG